MRLAIQAPSWRTSAEVSEMKSELQEKLNEASLGELYDLIYLDNLTGCFNRTAIEHSKTKMFVAVVDLDSLKYINDNMGHTAGDNAICALADALVKAFGPENVYRVSGDEFVVTTDDALLCRRKILTDVRHDWPGFSFGVGISFAEADSELQIDKRRSLINGHRSERGEKPYWFASKEAELRKRSI